MDDLTARSVVIMPVLNEEQHLAEAVAAITGQDYRGPLQIALALGPSTDATDDVARQLQAEDPRILLVPNPPAGPLRVSTPRSRPPPTRSSCGSMATPCCRRTTSAPPSRSCCALARTTSGHHGRRGHGLRAGGGLRDALTAGRGAASFHTGGQGGPALTVYLGRSGVRALDRVGGYDEAYVRAQDWEMNHRIRSPVV